MTTEPSKNVPGMQRRFVPHRTLHGGWTYFQLEGSDMVIGIKVEVVRTYETLQADGKTPWINQTGYPNTEWEHSTSIKYLTSEQFNQLKYSQVGLD